MRSNKLFFSLQTTIIMLVCGILILALFVTDFLVSGRMAENIQKDTAEKTTYIARMVVNSAVVIEGLTGMKAINAQVAYLNAADYGKFVKEETAASSVYRDCDKERVA